MPRRLLFAILALLSLAQPTFAQTRPADEPVVSIITLGPGPMVFERFGHNAIRVQIPSRRVDYWFDWGNFSFDDPAFISRFIFGDTRYWMAAKDAPGMIDVYARREDRTVTEQTLRLTAAQSARLLAALDAKNTEATRYYRYDYFIDNCSTRVRDAIDAAANGQLRPQMQTLTPHGYRWQMRRLVPVGPDNVVLSALMDFCAGPRADRPLSEWDTAFLPMELSRRLDTITVADDAGNRVPFVTARRVWNTTTSPGNAEPATADSPAVATTLIGVALAATMLAAARFFWPGFVALAFAWESFAAIGALFFTTTAAFTRHWVVSWNVNALQFSPLAFVVLAAMILGRRWPRLRRAADASLVLSVIAAAITILSPQRAAPAIGLALPLHAAVFLAVSDRSPFRFRRPVAEGLPS